MLVAQKWDYSKRKTRKPDRAPVSEEVAQLVLRMAQENPSWDYDRIQGALANLGHNISDQAVGNILKAHGIEPASERKRNTSWKTFLKVHWNVLGAIDFTTVEVWTKGGLATFYLRFVMKLASRRVCFAGCTTRPNDAWKKQISRNLPPASNYSCVHLSTVVRDSCVRHTGKQPACRMFPAYSAAQATWDREISFSAIVAPTDVKYRPIPSSNRFAFARLVS